MSFSQPIDIMNRACQLLGVPRIVSLTEDSRQASEMAFVYDKLRRVELRRNVWRFAIRQTAIRAVTSTTKNIVFATYASGTTYAAGALVIDTAGQLWMSNVASNVGNTPGASTQWDYYFGPLVADEHDETTGYFAGEIAYVSSTAYLSLVTGNADVPPSSNWLTLSGATLSAFTAIYPIGSGPTTDSSTKNIYRLPANFLRKAPQSPKAGSTSYLGAPSGLSYGDWDLQGNFLVTAESLPIVLRFVADVYSVPDMDDMFAEGLAAKCAENTCEIITQSNGKLQSIKQAYNVAIGEARAVNGVETGSTEPPEDDWIVCRQ